MIFTSLEIQAELERKLRTKFGLSDQEAAQILLDFSTFTKLISTSQRITVIEDDPDDDKFIDCYLSSDAEYLVSNDQHFAKIRQIDFPKINLYSLKEFEIEFGYLSDHPNP